MSAFPILSQRYGDPVSFNTEQSAYLQHIASDIQTLQMGQFAHSNRLNQLEADVNSIKISVHNISEGQKEMMSFLREQIFPAIQNTELKNEVSSLRGEVRNLTARFDSFQNSLSRIDERLKSSDH